MLQYCIMGQADTLLVQRSSDCRPEGARVTSRRQRDVRPARRVAARASRCHVRPLRGTRLQNVTMDAHNRRQDLEVLERRRAKEDECDAVATAERSSSKKAKRLVEVIALHCERGSERGEQG